MQKTDFIKLQGEWIVIALLIVVLTVWMQRIVRIKKEVA